MDTLPARSTEPRAPVWRTTTDVPVSQERTLSDKDRTPSPSTPLVMAGIGMLSTLGLAMVGSLDSDPIVRVILLVGAVVALATMAVTCMVHRTRVESLGAELAEARSQAGHGRDREATLAESRRQLVAWVSDDLQTPLTRLQATAEALEDGVIVQPLEVAAALSVMSREIDDVAGLVSDLHELSQVPARDGRIDAGGDDPQVTTDRTPLVPGWGTPPEPRDTRTVDDGHPRDIFDAVFLAAPPALPAGGNDPVTGAVG